MPTMFLSRQDEMRQSYRGPSIDWFQRRRLLNTFPIRSYVKTMSTDSGHFRRRSRSLNTILEVDHLRPSMTCLLYWLTGFRGEDLKTFFPIGFYVKTMSTEGGHLGWRSGSPDTILKIDHLRTIHAMFALNWLTGFKGEDF
jgi:hypothetical protein